MISVLLLVAGLGLAYAAVAVAVYDAVDRVEDLRLLARYEERDGRRLTDEEVEAGLRTFAACWILTVPLMGMAMLIEWFNCGGPPPGGW